jgi:hypothetical protein
MKPWLYLEIAKRKGIAMGLKLLTPEEFFSTYSPIELFCHVYTFLKGAEEVSYLKGKIVPFTEEVTALITKYAKYEFVPEGWQAQLMESIFGIPPQKAIAFGIDEMPPLFWRGVETAYLFSPCKEFWGDVCSDRERKKLGRFWKKKGASLDKRNELDSYLREAPRLLANWGKLGRETLKIFEEDDFEEAYEPLKPDSMLKRVQANLLFFEKEPIPKDASIKIFQTGSSKWKEIECLKEEILRLDIPYHEISVLAPDMEPYVPLIEFVFGEEIPYRISGFDIAPQSSFRQGMERILRLAGGRWEAEEVLALFETPSFFKKRKWDGELLEKFRKWVEWARIDWGFDEKSRQEILEKDFGKRDFVDVSSWEKGLDRLLEAIVKLSPVQIQADPFEEFLKAIQDLRRLDLSGEKTLSDWGYLLGKIGDEFLVFNGEEDGFFAEILSELRKSTNRECYPLEVVQHLLLRPSLGQIHPSHLHAVRFAPLQSGALFPAKAVFLIGMDEESFPKVAIPSSIDQLKNVPQRGERDRYLFLQALFSAEEFLRISYGHLSPDEGKAVGPSLVVQELLDELPKGIVSVYQSPSVELSKKEWPSPKPQQEEKVVSLSDLRSLARHPWKFFLQKGEEISIDEPVEESFGMLKGKLVREAFETGEFELSLPGIAGEALKIRVEEEVEEWNRQLKEWGIDLTPVVFRESCKEKFFEEGKWICPPIQIGSVKIVGEVRFASEKGFISLQKDQIGETLKIWPEALAVAIGMGAPKIWMVQSGKCKEIEDPGKALELYLDYYFKSKKELSPLLSDWADSLLRKGLFDFEKQVQKERTLEDPVYDWIKARFELPEPKEMVANWDLKQTFAGLIVLYPTRKKHETV